MSLLSLLQTGISQAFSFVSLVITLLLVSCGYTASPTPVKIVTLTPTVIATQTFTQTPTTVALPTFTPTCTLQPVTLYTVKSGDTLSSIAELYKQSWVDIANYNKLNNPNEIYPGDVIEIDPSGQLYPKVDPNFYDAVTVYSGDTKNILIDISDQTLTAFEGQKEIYKFIISSGVAEFPTVFGQFKIWVKLESTEMSGDGYYKPGVPYTMYFYQGYGIHGTYWHDNFGTPMSHGCINMRTNDAKKVFEWAEVGTIVQVVP